MYVRNQSREVVDVDDAARGFLLVETQVVISVRLLHFMPPLGHSKATREHAAYSAAADAARSHDTRASRSS